LQFDVRLPPGVPARQSLLVASTLSMAQHISPPLTSLKAGDSLTRSVTLDASGALGLALPVTPLGDVQGLSRYLETPQVLSLDDGRGQALGARRTDSVRYRIEQPGNYRLPALQVQWWSTTDQQLHTATVPAVTFSAIANPAYTTVFSVHEDLQRLGQQGRLHLSRHSLGILTLVALAGLLWWLSRRFGAALRARWQRWQDSRRHRWLASAEYAWSQVPGELGQHPAHLPALYRWWRRSQGSVRLASTSNTDVLRRVYGPGQAQPLLSLEPELAHLHAQASRRSTAAPSCHGLHPLNPRRNRESR